MSGTTITGTTNPDDTVGGASNDTMLGAPGAAADPAAGGTADADTLRGLGGNDLIFGGGGNDSIDGGAADDVIFGGLGADTILGGIGNDTISAGLGRDSVLGGDGDDAISTGSNSTVFGNAGNDSIYVTGDDNLVSTGDNASGTGAAAYEFMGVYGNRNTLIASNQSDTIYLDASYRDNRIDAGNGPSDVLVVTQGNFTIDTFGSGSNQYQIITFPNGNANTIIGFDTVIRDDIPAPICFAAGTDILTARGEVMVQELRTGDLVATIGASGAPLKPVLWVGRRRIALAGNPNAHRLAPVRIEAGALAENTPHRDLLVSPDHCLFLDGMLVPARLLVNGTSIRVERGLTEVTYHHVELERHDVLLANGAAAESWLDAGNRAWFENAPLALLRVADTPDAHAAGAPNPCATDPCAPIIQGGARLAAIRDAIALRAGRAGPAAEEAQSRTVPARRRG
ncbi:Hint domain-containing protein [Falsiroseomonas sp. HW251]|uniref:Hint domain-containing protein n=1 Tax=Falsiroseomonas sp. HW251 TaxID=3390998 RepID=UPI003D320A86